LGEPLNRVAVLCRRRGDRVYVAPPPARSSPACHRARFSAPPYHRQAAAAGDHATVIAATLEWRSVHNL
jgi:hypothetical protein